MIISHRYRFIMIKTAKTAGTSLEIALSKYLGPNDVITPISQEDEDLRRELGYRGPQNYYVGFSQYEGIDWARLLVRRRRLQYYNHAPAAFIKRYVGGTLWNSYYKFAFERNPWDKAVSVYWWRNLGRVGAPSVQEYVASGRANDVRGFDLYSIKNQVVVDRLFRYEQMNGALEELSAHVGLPEVPSLPHAKGRFRQDRRHYREVLDAAAQEAVSLAYAREIAYLGYTY